MPRRNKSFYHLEFSVDPGGAHKEAHYIRDDDDDLDDEELIDCGYIPYGFSDAEE